MCKLSQFRHNMVDTRMMVSASHLQLLDVLLCLYLRCTPSLMPLLIGHANTQEVGVTCMGVCYATRQIVKHTPQSPQETNQQDHFFQLRRFLFLLLLHPVRSLGAFKCNNFLLLAVGMCLRHGSDVGHLLLLLFLFGALVTKMACNETSNISSVQYKMNIIISASFNARMVGCWRVISRNRTRA